MLDVRISGMVRVEIDQNQDVGEEVDVREHAAKFESEFRRHLDALWQRLRTAILDQLADRSMDLPPVRAKVRRPAHADDARVLAKRVTAHPDKKVVLFQDNSGANVVLGVLPLAQFFVQWANMIVAVKSGPAINDVTLLELMCVMGRVSDMDKVVAHALESQRLQILASGSESPCQDLGCADDSLAHRPDGAEFGRDC
ncbi:Pantothenate kinase 4 [Allomyces javanicus]|nr:Pantothenate kinase 4 [Allomyces javanicus]